jgi:transposase
VDEEVKAMMTDPSNPIPCIPKETARAANAIFGRGNFHILIGEHLGNILEDIQLEVFSTRGNSKLEGAILALITFFQFVEGLTDIQAADAVQTRTDWKFALHLSLIPVMFHEETLCQFRQKILIDPVSQHEFQKLADQLAKFIPAIKNNIQNLSSEAVVASVCSINRLNQVQQAVQQALEVLAFRFPEWLRKVALPHWYGRYNHGTPRLEVAMLLGQQRFLIEEMGGDIQHLLNEVQRSDTSEVRELHEIKALNQIWEQQFQARKLNHWPEKLSLDDCRACPHKLAGRRN